MNTQYNDLESTVQHYVLGKLTEAQAEEFEAYYLSNPDVVEMVETAQQIHIGLANAPNESAFEKVDDQSGSILKRIIAWLTVPIPAFAVLAAAAVFIPLALNDSGPGKNHQQIAIVNFSTAATRGVETSRPIDLSQVDGSAAVMIKLKQVSYPYYKLKIYPAGEQKPLWTSNQFQVSALRDQLVIIPDRAKINDATIKVVGIDNESNETVVEFCHYSEVCR